MASRKFCTLKINLVIGFIKKTAGMSNWDCSLGDNKLTYYTIVI